MGLLRASIWTALGVGFTYAEMSGHVIWANWIAVIWITMFAWQITVSTTKKERKKGTTDRR